MTPCRFDLLCLGEVLVDLISESESDRLEDCHRFSARAGGSPANLARFASRRGLRTGFVGRIGPDGAGRLLRNALEGEGVDTAYLQVARSEPTSVCLVTRSSGTPDFVLHRRADTGLTPRHVPAPVAASTRVLHTNALSLATSPLGDTAMKAIRAAHAAGRHVSLDPNWRPGPWAGRREVLRRLEEAAPMASFIKPSLDDARALLGKGSPETHLRKFAEMGVRTVLLTMGIDGLLILDEGKTTHVTGPARTLRSATGAGDAFLAVFLSRVLAGDDAVEAARRGVEEWLDLRDSEGREKQEFPSPVQRTVV